MDQIDQIDQTDEMDQIDETEEIDMYILTCRDDLLCRIRVPGSISRS